MYTQILKKNEAVSPIFKLFLFKRKKKMRSRRKIKIGEKRKNFGAPLEKIVRKIGEKKSTLYSRSIEYKCVFSKSLKIGEMAFHLSKKADF